MSDDALGLAHEAALRAVGVPWDYPAAERYRRAVNAAIEAVRGHIAAEALRMATAVAVVAGQQVHDAAITAYFAAGSLAHGVSREDRVRAAINAACPLIQAEALRDAASYANDSETSDWLFQRAGAIERGEVT